MPSTLSFITMADPIHYDGVMEWAVGGIVGLALGVAAALLACLARRATAQRQMANSIARAELLDQQLIDLRSELAQARDAASHAEQSAARLQAEHRLKERQFEEQRLLLEQAEKKLTTTFEAAGAKALRENNEAFIALAKKAFETLLSDARGDVEKKQQAIDSLVKPIKELLEKQNAAVGELEKKRVAEHSGLQEQLRQIATAHEKLNSETSRLVKALRRPEQRGRWGEVQLRNAVELAGMVRHCDFDEQVTIWNGEASSRPDMVVNLPARGAIPVDAKVAIDAYLDALDCEDAEAKAACLRRHADQVERHCRALANKRYWDGFDKARAPQMVVLFMPLESALVAALEIKPELHHEALQQHVLIATPTLLIALLRAAAYGWQQDAVAENAREIARAGAELYSRVQKFTSDLEKLGRSLGQATGAYNAAVGSLESRVLPGVRKLKEYHVTTNDDVVAPPRVEIEPREIVTPALKLFEVATTQAGPESIE